jgi:hypothetical protein
MSEAFDPYLRWLGIRDPKRPPNHYRLLGIELFESDPDVIASAADRQMAHVRTFQAGKHSTLSQKLLNELAAAKICLLSARKKAEYDAVLRGGGVARSAEPPPLPQGATAGRFTPPPVPPSTPPPEPPPLPTFVATIQPPPLPDAKLQATQVLPSLSGRGAGGEGSSGGATAQVATAVPASPHHNPLPEGEGTSGATPGIALQPQPPPERKAGEPPPVPPGRPQEAEKWLQSLAASSEATQAEAAIKGQEAAALAPPPEPPPVFSARTFGEDPLAGSERLGTPGSQEPQRPEWMDYGAERRAASARKRSSLPIAAILVSVVLLGSVVGIALVVINANNKETPPKPKPPAAATTR